MKFTEKKFKSLTYIAKIRNFIGGGVLFYPVYMYNFGLKRTRELAKVRSNRILYLNKCMDFLEEDFGELIAKYKSASVPAPEDSIKAIWICWLQGEDKMPKIVSDCYSSLKRNAPEGCKVKLVTIDNVESYIEIPDYIWSKVNNGKISLTHFSDIIRFSLLSKYGGLWIDSTVFVSSNIGELYSGSSLYGIQNMTKSERLNNLFYGCVTSFLIGGSAHHPLFDFCLEFFLEYQKKYNRIIDVHWINLCYAMAYKNFDWAREEIERIGLNNKDVGALYKHINEPFSKEKWTELTSTQVFHKMNWRSEYCTKKDEQKTMYGHLAEMNKEN